MMYAKLIGAGLVLAALVWLGLIVNGWRTDAAQAPALKREVAQAQADRDAQIEAARLSAEKAGAAEMKLQEAVKASGKVRTVYLEATREDPDCAAWSRARVMCPLGSMRDGTGSAAERVSGDPGQPDP